jgi:DMSO reductase anchor subunit
LHRSRPEWNLAKLNSRENPLVAFTLITQGVVGAFLVLLLGRRFGLDLFAAAAHPIVQSGLLIALLGAQAGALAVSTMHLGKPQRFYRAFYNLRYSPVSREVAAIAVFFNALGLYAGLVAAPGLADWISPGLAARMLPSVGALAAVAGVTALFAMYRIYRIKARPFWDHWQVLTSFYGSMLTFGGLIAGLVYGAVLLANGEAIAPLFATLAWPIGLGLALESGGLIAHARTLERNGGEGAASHREQQTTFGCTYRLRNAGLAVGLALIVALAAAGAEGVAGYALWFAAALVIAATAVIGRALFYVLVIPTTMPGAFFWRNRGFEEHARKTGLAKMPQVGVLPAGH